MQDPSSRLWRTTVDLNSPLKDAAINQAPNTFTKHAKRVAVTRPTDREGPSRIALNDKWQRIDIPKELHVNLALVNELRKRSPRLCNSHHLLGGCTDRACPYDHSSMLTNHEFEALLYLSRGQRCPKGSDCIDTCFKGHMCPNGRNCRHGNDCRFADMHGIDTTVVDSPGQSNQLHDMQEKGAGFW